MVFIVHINSSIFNTLEFVLFDLLFAAAVHDLTSKLVGLYNCLEVKKDPANVHLRNELRVPLLDEGIVSTKRKVFYAVVSIRMVSWALIIGASLLVKGISIPVITETTANVVTLGSFSIFDDTHLRLQNKIRSQACVRRVGSINYQGEIRDGSCVLSRELLSSPIIETSTTFEPTQITTSGCKTSNSTVLEYRCNPRANNQSKFTIFCTFNGTDPWREPREDERCYVQSRAPHTPCKRNDSSASSIAQFSCEWNTSDFSVQCNRISGYYVPYGLCKNAVIACTTTKTRQCSGLISVGNRTHLCENVDDIEDMNNSTASCKWVKGGEWNITDWVSFFGAAAVETISNVYFLAYGSRIASKPVKIYIHGKFQQVTEVPWEWIVIMLVKVLLVLGLFCFCERLRKRHTLLAIANDEWGIYCLVRSTIRRRNRALEPLEGRSDRLVVKLVNEEPMLL